MFHHIKFGYKKNYLENKKIKTELPLERPKLDYKEAAIELRKNNFNLEKEIKEIKEEIEKEKKNYSIEYDNLEKEQSELCDLKYSEIDQLTLEIKLKNSKIVEIQDWIKNSNNFEQQINNLEEEFENLSLKNIEFIEFINSLIKIIQSIKNPNSGSVEELFNPKQSISRIKGNNPLAILSNNLFTLRQNIIRIYAQNCTNDCHVQ